MACMAAAPTHLASQTAHSSSFSRAAQRPCCSLQHGLQSQPVTQQTGTSLVRCRQQQQLVCRAVATLPERDAARGHIETVADVMTRGFVFKCTRDTSLDDALEMLVNKKVTGLPVVDEEDRVVGIVSDYDLLSFDAISGKMEKSGLFPETSVDWKAFKEVQRQISKNSGKTVEDVMTEDPLTVRPGTNVEAAARILIERKVRRLPVVDEDGRLIGMFTRRDVIKAALASRRRALGA